jgi:DNA-binding NtrC family response regulator
MDIPVLLGEFLKELLADGTADEAIRDLPASIFEHPFPGNIRELRNCAERYAALREAGCGWPDVLEPHEILPGEGPSQRASAGDIPRSFHVTPAQVMAALKATQYHRGKAAAMLGISRRTIQYRLQQMRASAPPA